MGAIRLNEVGRPGKRQSVQGNGIRAALDSTVRNCKGSKTEEDRGGRWRCCGLAQVSRGNVESIIVCMGRSTLIAPTTIAYGLLLRLASRDY